MLGRIKMKKKKLNNVEEEIKNKEKDK